MIRWNLFFEVEKVEQLALIDPLATHHDRPPSLKASGKRNHDSSIFTRPFSTGSVNSGVPKQATASSDVRFPQKRTNRQTPRLAKCQSQLYAPQQTKRIGYYSITSSASNWIELGTSMPSAGRRSRALQADSIHNGSREHHVHSHWIFAADARARDGRTTTG